MSRTPEQRREFNRLLEDMQCARCDGPQHEGACADRPPVSGEPRTEAGQMTASELLDDIEARLENAHEEASMAWKHEDYDRIYGEHRQRIIESIERWASTGADAPPPLDETDLLCRAMQAHQDTNGRLPAHARYHCGGTCGYDIARHAARLLAEQQGGGSE